MLPANVVEANLNLPAGPNTVTIRARDGSGNEATKNYSVNVTGGAASYTYEANGNLETKTEGVNVWVYEWNAMNQLIEVKKGTTVQNATMVATFGYDPIGRRILKATPTRTVPYTYDGADILRENVTISGSTVTSYYVHGPGIDEPLSKETGGVLTYYHADGLGSIAKETNRSGVVTNTLRYDAWGNIETGARDGFAFTGRERDPETGLYYYRARYYDAVAGRFISEDPIGFLGGANRFAYVAAGATRFKDPMGTDLLDTVGGLVVNPTTANLAAGFGQVVSFGFADEMEEAFYKRFAGDERGYLDVVDECSASYRAGWWAGVAHSTAMLVAGGLNGGARSVFWSRPGNKERAAQLGESLESTLLGKALDRLAKHDRFGKYVPYAAWKAASRIYAENASGTAIKVGTQVGNIYRNIEAPVLSRRGIPVVLVP